MRSVASGSFVRLFEDGLTDQSGSLAGLLGSRHP